MISNLYDELDKKNFYLGVISQVHRDYSVLQVENMSWLKFRKIRSEVLIPNTINYLVVIESRQGLFLGEIYQSKLPSTESVHSALVNSNFNHIYPELYIDIIGVMLPKNNFFQSPGFLTVGLTDQVYIANQQIIDLFLNSMELDNKKETKLSPFAHYKNMPTKKVSLYPSTLFNRHIMVVGTTNSGKSTSALSILDKLIEKGKKVLIIDPTGEYSDSFHDIKEEKIETDYSANSIKMETERFRELHLGTNTKLNPGALSFQQWSTLFDVNEVSQPAILADAIISLRYVKSQNKCTSSTELIYTKKGKEAATVSQELGGLDKSDREFDLESLPLQLQEEAVRIDNNDIYVRYGTKSNAIQWLIDKVKYKFKSTKILDFFSSSENIEYSLEDCIDDFINNRIHTLYINTSTIGMSDSIGELIIDWVCKHIIESKTKTGITKENLAFVLYIDEVHRYTKTTLLKNHDAGLTLISREGRKKGVFLFLTTQNPQDVPKELLGQVGTLLIHRVTHRLELEALKNYVSKYSYEQIPLLDQGEAILTSINLLRDLQLQIMKSNRIHKNGTPLL